MLNKSLLLVSGKSSVDAPKVAFFVGLGDNLGEMEANADLVMDRIITNVGESYNEATGRFTAPAPGTYHFTVVVAAQGRQKVVATRVGIPCGVSFACGVIFANVFVRKIHGKHIFIKNIFMKRPV